MYIRKWIISITILTLSQTEFLIIHAKGEQRKQQRKKNAAPPEKIVQNLKGSVPSFYPSLIVDVGANKGKWTEHVRRMYPNATFFMVEASEQHESALQKFVSGNPNTALHYEIALLSSRDLERVNFFNGGDTGNSMFREKSDQYTGRAPVVKKTTWTLDTLVRKHEFGRPVDLIKVDVQGAELVVLQGATSILKEATFLQLEASTVAYNEGGSCHWQVDAFLRRHGWALYDLGERQYYPPLFKTRGLGQYDVIYINTQKLPPSMGDAEFCLEGSREPVQNHEELLLSCQITSVNFSFLVIGLLSGYAIAWLQRRFAATRIRRRD